MTKFLTTKELAKMLGITVAGVNKQIKVGKIIAKRDKNSDYIIDYNTLSPAIWKKIELRKKELLRNTEATMNEEAEVEDIERSLWKSAEILRGSVDAAKYKHIVLGLIFLKYLNDSFHARQEHIRKGTVYMLSLIHI